MNSRSSFQGAFTKAGWFAIFQCPVGQQGLWHQSFFPVSKLSQDKTSRGPLVFMAQDAIGLRSGVRVSSYPQTLKATWGEVCPWRGYPLMETIGEGDLSVQVRKDLHHQSSLVDHAIICLW